MSWLAVDKSGQEVIGDIRPVRVDGIWVFDGSNYVVVHEGTINRLIGCDLTWEDEPVEI